MGKPRDPEYWRKYRAAHPEYQERERTRLRNRDRTGRDRSKEYAKRPSRALAPLPVLYPDLRRGQVVSFWEDELCMDLAQEAALAALEGADVKERVRAYRAREQNWWAHRAPLIEEAA